MAKCLVLGANGFIGSHLVDSLVKLGHSVRAFDRFSNSDTKFNNHNAIEIFSGDFLNRHDLETSLKEVDYVFHFISTTTPITADADPLIDVDTNIRMSVEMLQLCVDNGSIKKVIFASTGGAIYGLNSGESINEDVTPLPISPYAIGKLTIEHYLRYFEKKHGLSSLIYRISNPYGERQSLAHKQGVIPIFLQHIANHEPITVLGDGSMVRDYVYVKDVAHMVASSFELAKMRVYNLGSGHGVSVSELIGTIKDVLRKDVPINSQPSPSTFVEKIVLDTSRFEGEFGIKPMTSLDEGILKTWEYINL
jgi:UDP-glucose 4-epimerase